MSDRFTVGQADMARSAMSEQRFEMVYIALHVKIHLKVNLPP